MKQLPSYLLRFVIVKSLHLKLIQNFDLSVAVCIVDCKFQMHLWQQDCNFHENFLCFFIFRRLVALVFFTFVKIKPSVPDRKIMQKIFNGRKFFMGTITLHLDNRYGIYRERFFISKSSSHLGLWNQPTTVASFSYFSRQLFRRKFRLTYSFPISTFPLIF